MPFLPHSAQAATPPVSIAVTGPSLTVFDPARNGCELIDIPDAPAHAFRDYQGNVHLVSSHYVNRASVGPDFAHLRRDCHVLYIAAQNPDPSRYDFRKWLHGFVTLDGRTVFAVTHSEYEGNTIGNAPMAFCTDPTKCWWNSVTTAMSVNGGYDFRAIGPAPGGVVAASPYRYAPNQNPVGYFNPSNPVSYNGQWFFMAFATPAQAQAGGMCLLRAPTLTNPAAWRAWDGHDFTIALSSPYASAAANAVPAQHVCAPVGSGQLFLGATLVHHTASGLFVAVEWIQAAGTHPAGFYVTGSADLIHWSAPSLILSDAAMAREDVGRTFTYGFPSLIDTGSSDRSFIATGSTPDLFYIKLDQANRPYGRILVRRSVRITP